MKTSTRVRLQRSPFPQIAATIVVLIALSFVSCSSRHLVGRQKSPTIFNLADKTDRRDVLGASAIVLQGYNFTIQYANAAAFQSALRTNWRIIEETIPTQDGDTVIEFRDRALIHFSAKGYQGRQLSLVSSKIEFEIQMRSSENDKWVPISPDPRFKDQYSHIVDQIQNRLYRLGYRFN